MPFRAGSQRYVSFRCESSRLCYIRSTTDRAPPRKPFTPMIIKKRDHSILAWHNPFLLSSCVHSWSQTQRTFASLFRDKKFFWEKWHSTIRQHLRAWYVREAVNEWMNEFSENAGRKDLLFPCSWCPWLLSWIFIFPCLSSRCACSPFLFSSDFF